MYIVPSILDFGSSLHSARNDGIFGLSKYHPTLTPNLPTNLLKTKKPLY